VYVNYGYLAFGYRKMFGGTGSFLYQLELPLSLAF
jgi:hypothetical protein